jgi:hypothetical protein
MKGKKKFRSKNKYNISFINLYHSKKFLIFTILIFFSKDEIIDYFNYNLYNFSQKSFKQKINIGVLTKYIKNGGIERVTSLILNHFNKVKLFKLILFSQRKQKDEYYIDNNIERIILNNNLIKLIKLKKIDILLYQFYNYKEINVLNRINHLKLIVINHSCFLFWLYTNRYYFFKTYYEAYKNCDYTISLVPFENDYLFKKWGINSILISNFVQYEYNEVKPSDLTCDIILMIGRGNDRYKRFNLGIKAMKYIIHDIPKSEMKFISNTNNNNWKKIISILFLQKLTKNLKLENYVKFVGYSSNPSIYYKNASIHLFPTICESFGNVLAETKIYGIPNILIGLDYVAASKGGTVIIYDDSPLSLSTIVVKILKNKRFKKKLGLSARKSMKKFNNNLILKRWVKIILCIYKGKKDYQKLRDKDKKMDDKESIKLIEKQLNLLKYRNKKFMNLTLKDVINLTFMKNLK